MPKVDGVQVPTKLDKMTDKVWGHGVAVNILKSAITKREADFDKMMAAKSYVESDMKDCLYWLGKFHTALGYHYQVQAARQSDSDHEVKLVASYSASGARIGHG